MNKILFFNQEMNDVALREKVSFKLTTLNYLIKFKTLYRGKELAAFYSSVFMGILYKLLSLF